MFKLPLSAFAFIANLTGSANDLVFTGDLGRGESIRVVRTDQISTTRPLNNPDQDEGIRNPKDLRQAHYEIQMLPMSGKTPNVIGTLVRVYGKEQSFGIVPRWPKFQCIKAFKRGSAVVLIYRERTAVFAQVFRLIGDKWTGVLEKIPGQILVQTDAPQDNDLVQIDDLGQITIEARREMTVIKDSKQKVQLDAVIMRLEANKDGKPCWVEVSSSKVEKQEGNGITTEFRNKNK